MPTALHPHLARYTILGADGVAAGTEELRVTRDEAGWQVTSRISAGAPLGIRAELTWQLDRNLITRLLHISSRDALEDEYELELSVTGNGVLAHRRGPDGPSQLELGWGPDAELDYVSAAFTEVLVARSSFQHAPERRVRAVHIGVEDLELTMLDQVYTVEPTVEPIPGPASDDAGLVLRCLTPSTGHRSKITTNARGEVLSYENLLLLESISLLG
jgi:hypothetical protein